MNANLFDNAKFGDMFLTNTNKQAIFLRFITNHKCAVLYVEDWGQVAVYTHNGIAVYYNRAVQSIIKRKEESK